MSYLIGFHWVWLLLALILGIFVGWSTIQRPRSRWTDGLVWLVIAIVVAGAVVALLKLIPGRPGYWLEVAQLMAFCYFAGCPIGLALRQAASRAPASVDHDSGLPKPGYVFPGGTLGGIPAASSTSVQAPEDMRAQPVDAPPTPMADPAETPAHATSSFALARTEPVDTGTALPSVAVTPPEPDTTAPFPEDVGASASLIDATAAQGIRVTLGSDPLVPEPQAPAPDQTIDTTAGITAPQPDLAPNAEPLVATLAAAALPEIAPAPAADAPQKMPPVPGEARHAGLRPDGLIKARDDKADDLKRIKGIGPQNEGRLHGLGIWHFDQIASWTSDNVKWVGSYLAFHGRIERENWVDQATMLAQGLDTGFSKRVTAGKVATSRDDGGQGQTNVDPSVKRRKQ